MNKNMINEERLFSNVVKNMGSPKILIEELVENARRSNARELNITLMDNILTVSNNGDVLTDFSKLLILAESEYDEDVCRTENPAGMGIYLILASTQTAIFKSGYKILPIQSQSMFDRSEYRNSIMHSVTEEDDRDYIDGFTSILDLGDNMSSVMDGYISLDPKKHFNENSYQLKRLGYYFDIDITINGKLVKKTEINLLAEKEGVDTLEGMRFGIAEDSSARYGQNKGYVYWHGKKIEVKELAPFSVFVSDNHLFKPKLPTRTELINSIEEINIIHAEIERQLSGEIQKFLDTPFENIPNVADDIKEQFLSGLKQRYNTDKVMYWSGVSFEEKKDALFYGELEDLDIKITEVVDGVPQESGFIALSYMGIILSDKNIFELGYTTRIASDNPSWVNERTFSEEDLEIMVYRSQTDVNNCGWGDMQMAEKINLVFAEDLPIRSVSTLIEESMDKAYITSDNRKDFHLYCLSCAENDNSDTYDDVEWEVRKSIETLNKVYDAKIDVLNISSAINTLLSTRGMKGKMASFEFSDGMIRGKTDKDEDFEYATEK